MDPTRNTDPFTDLFDRIAGTNEAIVVHRDGDAVAVIVDAEHLREVRDRLDQFDDVRSMFSTQPGIRR